VKPANPRKTISRKHRKRKIRIEDLKVLDEQIAMGCLAPFNQHLMASVNGLYLVALRRRMP